jgi:hypothetical protein
LVRRDAEEGPKRRNERKRKEIGKKEGMKREEKGQKGEGERTGTGTGCAHSHVRYICIV